MSTFYYYSIPVSRVDRVYFKKKVCKEQGRKSMNKICSYVYKCKSAASSAA